jgi:hypothetical protein
LHDSVKTLFPPHAPQGASNFRPANASRAVRLTRAFSSPTGDILLRALAVIFQWRYNGQSFDIRRHSGFYLGGHANHFGTQQPNICVHTKCGLSDADGYYGMFTSIMPPGHGPRGHGLAEQNRTFWGRVGYSVLAKFFFCVGVHSGRFADRASRLLTVMACHRPPRAAAIPRAFNASAMARSDVAPALCISLMMGSTFAA